ncbi:MAG: hypothetical protein WBW33_06730 [Bryobacteraceae bacterium]
MNESEETAVWPKIAIAFVAGLVLAGAGALVVVKTMAPKAPLQATQAATSPAGPSSSASQPAPVQDLAAQPAEPVDEPVAPSETAAAPPARKGHPSAFGDRPAKQPVTIARNTPPAQSQAQSPQATPPNETPSDAQQQVTQQQPQYAPPPDVAPVAPQSVHPADRAGQPDTRPDSTPPSPARQPQTVTLEAGTSLMVRLGETISTKTKVAGDPFRGTLDQPIILNGFIIADKGSKVVGRVVSAQKGGHLSGSSDLLLQVTEINTTDGQAVHVQTSAWEKKGDSNTVGNIEKIGGGAALGAIIGAVAGGGKGAAIGAAGGGAAGTGVAAATGGKPTVVPVETRIAFRLDAPVTITEQINN